MPASVRTRRQAAIWALISGGLAVAAGLILRAHTLGLWSRLLLAVAPVVPMVGYGVLTLRALREMDELEARIHLEGAIYGLLGSALLTMLAGLLTRGGILPTYSLGQLWPWLWIAAFLCWAAGCGVAGRRYR